MASGYINLPVEGGNGVTSINSLVGALTLAAGFGITITNLGSTITIAANAASIGVTSINADVTPAQTLVVGTSGTDFAIVDNGTGQHTFNLPTATSLVRGALSAADWTTFNAKQPAGSYITAITGDGTAAGPGSAALTLATVNSNVGSFGTASAVSSITVNAKGLVTAASNTSIQIAESQVTNLTSDLALKAPLASPALTGTPTAPTASQGNNSTQLATTAYVDTGLATKQATGNYITALTGDATAAGPGSVALTLATVNSNVGSFGSSTAIPSFTVNAKGLITAASTNAVIAPAGTLTGTTLASNVVTSSLTSVGTIATGVWNGTTIAVANGGTGQTSLSALTANPTASLGLTAVNGSASTFMRSDAAPALDVSISPVWTGLHTFSSAEPRILFNESDQGSNLKLWDFDVQAAVFTGRTRTDADAAGKTWLTVTRGATTAISSISLGNATDNPSYSTAGSGTFTINGGLVVGLSGTFNALLTAGRVAVASATLPANGIYLPAANTLGFSTNTTLAGQFDASGNFITKKATADQSYSLQVPTTGFSITIANNISTLILKPAGTLATGTITMPATPIDGQNVRFTSSQIITSLTVSPNSGQSIVGAPTTLGLGQGNAFIYSLSDTTWYRLY